MDKNAYMSMFLGIKCNKMQWLLGVKEPKYEQYSVIVHFSLSYLPSSAPSPLSFSFPLILQRFLSQYKPGILRPIH